MRYQTSQFSHGKSTSPLKGRQVTMLSPYRTRLRFLLGIICVYNPLAQLYTILLLTEDAGPYNLNINSSYKISVFQTSRYRSEIWERQAAPLRICRKLMPPPLGRGIVKVSFDYS